MRENKRIKSTAYVLSDIIVGAGFGGAVALLYCAVRLVLAILGVLPW